MNALVLSQPEKHQVNLLLGQPPFGLVCHGAGSFFWHEAGPDSTGRAPSSFWGGRQLPRGLCEPRSEEVRGAAATRGGVGGVEHVRGLKRFFFSPRVADRLQLENKGCMPTGVRHQYSARDFRRELALLRKARKK